jgi:hypothetical protein
MFNSSASYRFAPRFDDDDGTNPDCNPKVVKITSSRPISTDEARDSLLNFIQNEKEKDYSSSQRRRLDRLFHVVDGIPGRDNAVDKVTSIPTQSNEIAVGIQNDNDLATSNRHEANKIKADLVESNQDLQKLEAKKSKKGKKEAKKAKKAAKKEKKEKRAKKAKKESK